MLDSMKCSTVPVASSSDRSAAGTPLPRALEEWIPATARDLPSLVDAHAASGSAGMRSRVRPVSLDAGAALFIPPSSPSSAFEQEGPQKTLARGASWLIAPLGVRARSQEPELVAPPAMLSLPRAPPQMNGSDGGRSGAVCAPREDAGRTMSTCYQARRSAGIARDTAIMDSSRDGTDRVPLRIPRMSDIDAERLTTRSTATIPFSDPLLSQQSAAQVPEITCSSEGGWSGTTDSDEDDRVLSPLTPCSSDEVPGIRLTLARFLSYEERRHLQNISSAECVSLCGDSSIASSLQGSRTRRPPESTPVLPAAGSALVLPPPVDAPVHVESPPRFLVSRLPTVSSRFPKRIRRLIFGRRIVSENNSESRQS